MFCWFLPDDDVQCKNFNPKFENISVSVRKLSQQPVTSVSFKIEQTYVNWHM